MHLNAIGGLEANIEKSYAYKLQVLLANEERIQPKYPRSLRLTDFMQSYNIYESELFFKEKSILDRIDKEMLELDFLEKDAPLSC